MNLTRAEAAQLGRRAQQPVRAKDELVAIFVGGKLANPLNGTPWIWQKHTRYARQWKDRVALALLDPPYPMYYRARTPKRVRLLALTWNTMDSDGLQAALKPIRDALIECGVIHSDAPDSGHEFIYSQRRDRARRGVEVRVSLQ